MDKTKPILEYSNITFQYNSETIIYNRLSFEVQEEEIVVLIGKSGTGKSTLLKLTNRLLELTQGDIFYKGKNIKDISPLQLRKQIGFLPQSPHLIEGTVKDNLLLPYPKKEQSKDLDALFINNLKKVGLSEKYLNKPSNELSIGEMQRVTLVRTLLNNSNVVLLDEPNSALDEENSQLLVQSLKRIVEEKKVTLLIVTHQLQFARQLHGRYLVLNDGNVEEVEDPKDGFKLEVNY